MINYLKDYILKKPLQRITYEEYIEQALYHPQYGYYMKEKNKIGREGDFITSSNISDIYGRSLANWFYKQVREYDLPSAICEIGAGTGRFAKAFIEEWNTLSTDPIHYYILEESPYHRKLQQEQIIFNERVKQIASLEVISSFHGLIFSNELFDAFPVHVIEKHDGRLMEVLVTIKSDQLAETTVPLGNDRIRSFLEASGLTLEENQRIEIPLQMENMISEIAKVLERGLVLTVDYGYSNKEWLEPGRRDGSLRGYYKHQQINNILEHPGEMDITSHVHFDSLIRLGNEKGLQFIKKWRQDEFLLHTGILEDLQENYDPNPFSEISKRNRAIRSLIMPSGMSSAFHVILQKKGMEK
ncbi:SAM-dependent methyltransferase [Bacillus sp. FJAT-29790]|uniref:class I SAM-dependent methyltransferase n=1 Tax=Bacillus sp. FJAT-29790 TaxID=1895002 RepID=UPI001C216C6A|nr:SAM-dependent methyltransferase [Bacillus sp. FJAT-29790]MBU8879373.1 SAM-dependent methyltransferase [Bacillus sp. FJAT-29790]